MSSTSTVDRHVPFSIGVGRFLISKGLYPADWKGKQSDDIDRTNGLGILAIDPESKPRKILFGLIRKPPLRRFLGYIQFEEDYQGVQAWTLESYGYEHFDQAQKLAEEMASAFNVRIRHKLVRDKPVCEGGFTLEMDQERYSR